MKRRTLLHGCQNTAQIQFGWHWLIGHTPHHHTGVILITCYQFIQLLQAHALALGNILVILKLQTYRRNLINNQKSLTIRHLHLFF